MSGFEWDRKGPPRPGSGSMDHPPQIERPYNHVTDEEKARQRTELAETRRAEAEKAKLIAKAPRLKARAKELAKKERSGVGLTFFEQAEVRRWRDAKRKLGL